MMRKRKKVKSSRPFTSRRAGLWTLLALATCSAVGISHAHQQKAAVTRILFNPNTQNIEVMHRFVLHDAEHAAGLIFGEEQRLLESAESRELFSSYVKNRFAIEATYGDGASAALELSYVGVEIDGQYLWVYQESGNAQPISAMTIIHTALQDVWPDQTNLVNIEQDGKIVSLNFTRDMDVQSVTL